MPATAGTDEVLAPLADERESPVERRLTGRVLDRRTDEPVPDLELRLEDSRGRTHALVTDRNGGVDALAPLGAGELAVRYFDAGLELAGAPTWPEDGELGVALGPTYFVRDDLPAGPPLEHWVFWLLQEGTPSNGAGTWRVHARRAGDLLRVRFPEMPTLSLLDGGKRSRFQVGAYDGERRWLGRASVDARAGVHADELVLDWTPCGRIDGVVRGPDGLPAADRVVELREAGAELPFLHARTDARGAYVLGPVPAGTWRVAVAEASESTGREVALAAGEDAEVSLRLAAVAPTSLAGVLTSSTGTHVPVGELRLVASDGSGREYASEARAPVGAGELESPFQFSDVPPGSYRLYPPTGDFFAWDPPWLDVAVPSVGARFDCRDDVPTVAVGFRPVDASSGEPIDAFRACLVVERTDEGTARALELVDTASLLRPLRHGEAAFERVPRGHAALWLVEADGFRSARGRLESLPGSEERHWIDVELERSWRVELDVGYAGPSGAREPLEGARVTTVGGLVLGSSDAGGSVFLELAYDPGPLEVVLEGWDQVGRLEPSVLEAARGEPVAAAPVAVTPIYVTMVPRD